MTLFDYAVLAVIAASVLLGAWRGIVSEVLALMAWVAAFFVGRTFAPQIQPSLAGWIKEPALQYIAAFAVVVLIVLLLVALLRFAISRLLRAMGLGPLDRVLGGVFGIARGLLVVLAAVLVGGLTALPQQVWWREAWSAPALETAVLAMKPWLPAAVSKRIKYQ